MPSADRPFIDAFERGDVRPADFHHADHLRLALAYLADSASLEDATARMTGALRRFAGANGASRKYHHSITVFWMRMVARLFDQQLPLSYYSRERLFSAEARNAWVEPDLQRIEPPSAQCPGTS